MQEALGESLVGRAITTATRRQGKKKRKESKQFGKKKEIINEKSKMNE